MCIVCIAEYSHVELGAVGCIGSGRILQVLRPGKTSEIREAVLFPGDTFMKNEHGEFIESWFASPTEESEMIVGEQGCEIAGYQ